MGRLELEVRCVFIVCLGCISFVYGILCKRGGWKVFCRSVESWFINLVLHFAMQQLVLHRF